MTTDLDPDPIPDRAELHARSAAQLRRAVKVTLVVVVTVFLVLALSLALVIGELGDPVFLYGIAGGLAALALMALVATLALRRQRPAVIWGTDSRTRGAIRRALREGRTDDRRIDALTREVARESLRHKWLLPAAILIIPLQVLALVVHLVDADWSGALPPAVFLVVIIVIVVQRRQEVGRQRAYLREPGPAERPDTAA